MTAVIRSNVLPPTIPIVAVFANVKASPAKIIVISMFVGVAVLIVLLWTPNCRWRPQPRDSTGAGRALLRASSAQWP